ncbi:DUF6346 domain-containing protein [Phytomonospora sp. NPDC050363]|uniref:DUF6346 domain-containing protein n=1 Tax=Phytomonospora sp. NPDC050363 TaxID=3155642 RepID=UPI0033E67692
MRHLRRFPSGLARRRAHRRVSRHRTAYLIAYLVLLVAPTVHALDLVVRTDPAWGGPAVILGLGACALGAAAFYLFTGAARMKLDADLAVDGSLLVAANDGERHPTVVDLHTPDVTVIKKNTRAGTRWLLRIRAEGGRRRAVVPLNDPRVGQVRCAEDLDALADVLAASPEPEGKGAAREIRALVPRADPRPGDAQALDDCVPHLAPRTTWDRVAAAIWALIFLAAGALLLDVALDGYRFQNALIAEGRPTSATASNVVDILMFASVCLLAVGGYRLLVKPFRRSASSYTLPRLSGPGGSLIVRSVENHNPSPPRPPEAGPRSLRFAEYPDREFGRAPRRIAAAVAGPVLGLAALAGPLLAGLAMLRGAQAISVPSWFWAAVSVLAFGLPGTLYWAHGSVVRHFQAVNRTTLWLDGYRLICDGPRGVHRGDLHSPRVRIKTVYGNAVLYVPVDGWWHRYPILLTQGKTDSWRPAVDLHRLVAALRTSPHQSGRVCATQILSIAPLEPGQRLPKLPQPSGRRIAPAVPAMPATVAGRGVRATALIATAAFVVLVGLTAASQAGGRPLDRADGEMPVLVTACREGAPVGPHGFGRLPECQVQRPDGSAVWIPGGEFGPDDLGRHVTAAYADGERQEWWYEKLLTTPGPTLVRADRPRDWSAVPMMVFALCGAALLFVQACRLAFRRTVGAG